MISQIYHLLKLIMKEEKHACIASKFSFLSCLPPSYSPSLDSMLHLPQPSIAQCRLVLHNTQTNKTFLPILTSFVETVIDVTILEKQIVTESFPLLTCRKLTAIEKKIKTLKTCYVHTRILSNSLLVRSQ